MNITEALDVFNTSETSLHAYAAGLLDGEGSIQINPSKGQTGKRYWCLTIQISSNNKEVLEWLKNSYGVGSITSWKSKKSTQGKTSYNWRTYSRESGELLAKVLPFMNIKKGQAHIALEFLKHKGALGSRLTPESIAVRNSLAKDIRVLNRIYGKGMIGEFPKGVL